MQKKTFLFNAPIGGKQRGSLILPIMPLIGLFALFLIISGKKFLLLNEERRQRVDTYLCLKNTMDRFHQLQEDLQRSNKILMAISASLLIKPDPILAATKKTIQISQQYKVSRVMIKVVSFCRGIQRKFQWMTFPIRMKGPIIQRNINGTAMLRKKKRQFLLPSRPLPPYLFIIRGTVHFLPKLKIVRSSEIALEREVRFL